MRLQRAGSLHTEADALLAILCSWRVLGGDLSHMEEAPVPPITEAFCQVDVPINASTYHLQGTLSRTLWNDSQSCSGHFFLGLPADDGGSGTNMKHTKSRSKRGSNSTGSHDNCNSKLYKSPLPGWLMPQRTAVPALQRKIGSSC